MKTSTIELDPKQARTLYREYKKHRHYAKPIDREIQRAYQLIAQGKIVISAIKSIKEAGIGADGRPLLALIRADQKTCEVTMSGDGGAKFEPRQWTRAESLITRLEPGSFPRPKDMVRGRAIVPIIPIRHRPKSDLSKYHILWEADWKDVPTDPLLLRRIGKADLWLVCAAWDLTDVERMALAGRVR